MQVCVAKLTKFIPSACVLGFFKAKMRSRSGLCPGPRWGTHSAPLTVGGVGSLLPDMSPTDVRVAVQPAPAAGTLCQMEETDISDVLNEIQTHIHID